MITFFPKGYNTPVLVKQGEPNHQARCTGENYEFGRIEMNPHPAIQFVVMI